jgi:hypothetical protein
MRKIVTKILALFAICLLPGCGWGVNCDGWRQHLTPDECLGVIGGSQ